MTTKAINEHLRHGHVVVLQDDEKSRICHDLFGNLVVVFLNNEPVRLATLSDKRKAKLLT